MERVTFEKDFLLAALIALAIHTGIVFTHIPLITPRPFHFKTENYGHLKISMVTTDVIKVEKPSLVSVIKKERKIAVKKEKKRVIKPNKQNDTIQKKEIIESPSAERVETPLCTPSNNETPQFPATLAKGDPEAAKVILAVPRYSINAPPIYPAVARRRGYQGVVLLSVKILKDGSVGKLRIKKTSGYHILDRSAMKAVTKWKFEPAKRMGCPVTMWVDVPLRFILSDIKVN